MRFAEFIDDRLRAYSLSAEYRGALHAEAPGHVGPVKGICPSWHPHGRTSTCYGTHGCRCDGCRAASARNQKRLRTARAVKQWRNEKETA